MHAPPTSITIHMGMSDMMGMMEERLYQNIRLTAMTSMMTSENILFSMGVDGLGSLAALVDCIAYAVATEVVLEIQNHSMLMGASRDVSIAGAGIITGWVR